MVVRPVQKKLTVEKETQRTVRVVFVNLIDTDHNQTVHYTVTTYRAERFGVYRNIFPANGKGDGEGKLPLLDFARFVKDDADMFPASALIEFMSEDLVV